MIHPLQGTVVDRCVGGADPPEDKYELEGTKETKAGILLPEPVCGIAMDDLSDPDGCDDRQWEYDAIGDKGPHLEDPADQRER